MHLGQGWVYTFGLSEVGNFNLPSNLQSDYSCFQEPQAVELEEALCFLEGETGPGGKC